MCVEVIHGLADINILSCQPMLKLKTHSGFHDLFLKYTMIAFIWGEHRKLSTWEWLFYLWRVDNCFNLCYSRIVILYGTGLKTDFQHTSGYQSCRSGCLPLYYICLGCPSGCFPRHQIFCKTSKLSYYFYIQNTVPDLLLCLDVLLYKTAQVPVGRGGGEGHLPPKNNITMDLFLNVVQF